MDSWGMTTVTVPSPDDLLRWANVGPPPATCGHCQTSDYPLPYDIYLEDYAGPYIQTQTPMYWWHWLHLLTSHTGFRYLLQPAITVLVIGWMKRNSPSCILEYTDRTYIIDLIDGSSIVRMPGWIPGALHIYGRSTWVKSKCLQI